MLIELFYTQKKVNSKNGPREHSLVAKTVVKDERTPQGVMLTFDDGTVLFTGSRSSPSTDHNGWSNWTQISINEKDIVNI